MGGKRTGGNRAKLSGIQPPSGPDSKDVVDDDTMALLYWRKQICGIWSHPEYADASDGFDGLMTKGVLTYAIKGKVFVDKAYAAKNFRSAKTRARGDRGNTAKRSEIPIGQTALDEFCLEYDAYKAYKWPAIKPTRSIIIPDP